MREAAIVPKTRPSYERAPALSFRLGTSPDVLSSVKLPDINLAVWRRSVDRSISRDLLSWAKAPATPFDAKVQAKTFDTSILVSTMPASLATWLSEDIRHLVEVFSQLTEAKRIRVQFHVALSDQCRKFHVDNLKYRLITTYLGPGTEYASENNVDRRAVDRTFCDHESANRAIIRDEKLVFRALAGDILLMKGLGAAPTMGAVHRSPPIESSGERRVVLVLSTVGA